MGFSLESVRLDPARLAGGSWWRIWGEGGRVLGEPTEDATQPAFLIVPKGSAFAIAKSEGYAPHRDKADSKTGRLPPDIEQQVHGQALARTVFRGMRNVSAKDGGPAMVWTEDKALELMTAPQWRAFFDFVDAASENRSVALAREEAAATGN